MSVLPILLGLSPLGGGDLHLESYELVKRLQGRGAYSDDEDSNRMREILAWAEVHADARQRLETLSASLLPDQSDELLSVWEAYLRVTNTAPRTLEERQARAQRFFDLAVAVDATTLQAFIDAIIPGSIAQTPTRATVVAQAESPEVIFHLGIKLTDAQFDDPRFRRTLDMLVRVLPTRNLGQQSRPGDVDQQLFTEGEVTWNGAQVLGRSAITNGVSKTGVSTRSPARFRDYGSLSRINAADLNGIQEAFVVEGVAGVSVVPSTHDGKYRFFSATLTNGQANQIDTGDWRDRIITLTCRIFTTDITPGGAAQTDANDLGNDYVVPMYTGDGEAGVPGGSARFESLITSDNYLRASSVDGSLEIYNDDIVDWYIVGCVWGSGDTGEAVVPPLLEDLIIAEFTAVSWDVPYLFLARASDVTLVTTKVSNWTNLGTGPDIAQGTDANRPTWAATGLNGLPALLFASSHWLSSAALDLTVPTAFTLTVLYQDTDAGIRYQAEYGSVNATFQGLLLRTNNPAGSVEGVAFDGLQPGATSAADFPMTSPSVVTVTWDPTLASLEITIRHGGGDVTSTRADVNTINYNGFNIAEELFVGARTAGTAAFAGHIAAVMLTTGSTAIPTAALARAEQLLGAEWGVRLEDKILDEIAAASWTAYGVFLAREADVTLVGSKVSEWFNHGTGGDAVQAVDATRPTWNANGIGVGRASLGFSAQRLVTAAVNASSDTAFAVIVLWKDTFVVTAYTFEWGDASTGVGILGPGVNLTAGNTWGQARNTVVSRANSLAPNYDHVLPSVGTLTWDSALATNECVIRDAGADVTDARTLNGNNAAPSLNDTLTIGQRKDGTTGIVGDIAAVIVIGGTTAIPTTDIANIEALLAAAWGV